jgi:hypothetical protein
MDLSCPQCKSDNTQKLSLLVEGGTSKISTTTFGVGGAAGHMAVGGASTKGVSVSKLAEKQAAPTKVPVISGSLAILFVAWLISVFAGPTAMTIGYVLVAAVVVFGWRYNWTKYPSEYAEWDKKFICMRCSNVFEAAPRQDAAVMELAQAT